MKLHPALLIYVVVILAGCASTGRIVYHSFRVTDIPAIGEVMKAEIGDTILKKAKIYSIPAIILEQDVKLSLGSVPPQTLVYRTRTDDWRFYWGEKGIYDKGSFFPGGICISTSGTEMKAFYGNTGGRQRFKQPPILKHTEILAPNKPSFSQELIYNGRLKDGVKFLYREFSQDMLRAAFSQELQYDLTKSRTVGFKGVRIEIIEATNTDITYIVKKGFPSTIP